MRITREQVEHIAKLSRIELAPEEKDLFLLQLGDILTYIEHISSLDIDDAEPSFHTWNLENIEREDAPRPSLSPDEALANAPERTDSTCKVPRIID